MFVNYRHHKEIFMSLSPSDLLMISNFIIQRESVISTGLSHDNMSDKSECWNRESVEDHTFVFLISHE